MNASMEARETVDFASTQFEIPLIQASPPTNERLVRNLSGKGEEPPRFRWLWLVVRSPDTGWSKAMPSSF